VDESSIGVGKDGRPRNGSGGDLEAVDRNSNRALAWSSTSSCAYTPDTSSTINLTLHQMNTWPLKSPASRPMFETNFRTSRYQRITTFTFGFCLNRGRRQLKHTPSNRAWFVRINFKNPFSRQWLPSATNQTPSSCHEICAIALAISSRSERANRLALAN